MMTKRAAIILAGGKASRFQSEKQKWQDKALIQLSGQPLLVHAVKNVQNHVDEIVISVDNDRRKTQYSQILKKHDLQNIRLLVDEKFDQLGGPLVAIYTGLKFTEAEYCITLPCDMPFIQPQIIEYMFTTVKETRVVVPMWPNGRLETLLMALERKNALEVASTLCNLKVPRSDSLIRGALDVLFVSTVAEIKALDHELKSFVNINSREDLIWLQPRHVQGVAKENMRLNMNTFPEVELRRLREAAVLSEKGEIYNASRVFASCAKKMEAEDLFFWVALSLENEGKTLLKIFQQEKKKEITCALRAKKALLRAAANYGFEAEVYVNNNQIFLAERARSNRIWCESLVKRL